MKTYEQNEVLYLVNLEKFANNIDYSVIDFWVDIQDSQGRNLVFFAKTEDLVNLIKNGFDINHLDKNGRNALFEADLNKTKELIKLGIDINACDKSGRNSLFKAGLNKSKLLIEAGINVNQRTNLGKTALFHCYDIDKFKLLEDCGLNANSLDSLDRNIIHKSNFVCGYNELFEYICEKYGLYCESVIDSEDFEKSECMLYHSEK